MKALTITIRKAEILFDVDAATHSFARATETASLRRADALQSDSGDTMNREMVVRFADRRAAELEERLGRFLASTTATAYDVQISGDEAYAFTLYVENAFEDTQLRPLAQDMESYIADGATADWYAANGDGQGAVYAQRLPLVLNRIIGHIVERKFPTRV